MARLIWTEPALHDLEAIADYIALDNRPAARKLVRTVIECVSQLSRFPEIGAKVPELKRSRYRQLVVRPCRIFFRFDGKRIYILHIMRGEQRLQARRLRRKN